MSSNTSVHDLLICFMVIWKEKYYIVAVNMYSYKLQISPDYNITGQRARPPKPSDKKRNDGRVIILRIKKKHVTIVSNIYNIRYLCNYF